MALEPPYVLGKISQEIIIQTNMTISLILFVFTHHHSISTLTFYSPISALSFNRFSDTPAFTYVGHTL